LKIGVVGFGMVGGAVARGFRKKGFEVFVNDIDEKKKEEAKKLGFEVLELEELVKRCDFIFVCVPTPCKDDGSCDVSIVESVFKKIVNIPVEEEKIIVIKSTVIPGTIDRLKEELKGNYKLVFNPEFLREKYAVEDFLKPWLGYIIVSGYDEAVDKVAELYKDFGAPTIKTKPKVAEMVKYVSNYFHATKISFANEVGLICKKLGINPNEVMNIIKIESFGGYYLDPTKGPFGGSCLPKDTDALLALCREIGFKPYLLEAVKKVNETIKGEK